MSVQPNLARRQAQAAERSRQADEVYCLAHALSVSASRARWFRRRRLRRLASDLAEVSLVLTEEGNRLER
jgi:hypothetical protein